MPDRVVIFVSSSPPSHEEVIPYLRDGYRVLWKTKYISVEIHWGNLSKFV